MVLTRRLSVKVLEQLKIKRTLYRLVDDKTKYHVTRTVGHNVHYLFSSRDREEALKYYREIPLSIGEENE